MCKFNIRKKFWGKFTSFEDITQKLLKIRFTLKRDFETELHE